LDIEFSEDQKLLRDSVQKMLRSSYDFETRQQIVTHQEGWSRELWHEFAEMGLLSAPFSEDLGGLGGGPISIMIVMEEFGRRLVVEPFFETVVVAGSLIEQFGSDQQRRELLPDVMSGNTIWALGWAEGKSRHDLTAVATRAEKRAGGYMLSGGKAVVTAAPWADKLIVSARTSGNVRDRDGISLFVIDRGAPNLYLKSFKTVDGRRASELALDGVFVPSDSLLGREDDAIQALENCRDRAIAALSAEAIGLMSELNSSTVDYSKVRRQFGVPLGSFQVLQHRMVDMYIALEESTAMTYLLNSMIAHNVEGTSMLAAAVKVKVGESARFIGEQSVQLHGGMGMSDELNVGHYFKRLASIGIQFGDAGYHLMRYAQTM
jgi:alkylation response protein AidB-like acyl-CoA dehydrogenase